MQNVDIIIAGGGCAGLSFLYRLLQTDWAGKKIVLIDKEPKTAQDKTWCFWEKEGGDFDDIVLHYWSQLTVRNGRERTFSIHPFRYKMIKSDAFYAKIHRFAEQFPAVTFVYDDITAVQEKDDLGIVATANSGTFSAPIVVDSVHKIVHRENEICLLQHFLGWEIHTEKAVFNPEKAVFMDFFRPNTAETMFMYLLPTSTQTALCEMTLFSEKVWEKEDYETEIRAYLQKNGIEDYRILYTECGVIPMNNHQFGENRQPIFRIGTSGGGVKSSTGFAFQRIQQQTKNLVHHLVAKETLRRPATRFDWYDSVFLDVLHRRRLLPATLFGTLFERNDPRTVLRFLSEETSLQEEIGIMLSLPKIPFLKATLTHRNKMNNTSN